MTKMFQVFGLVILAAAERERKRRGTRIFSSSLHDGDMEVIPYICLRLRVLVVVLREDRTFHQNFTLFGQRNVTQVNSLCRCDSSLDFCLFFVEPLPALGRSSPPSSVLQVAAYRNGNVTLEA